MAKKPAGLTLAQMVRPIRRFTDAANGLFAAMAQVEESLSTVFDNREMQSLPQIPWREIQKYERVIVMLAVYAAETAIEELAQDLLRMGDHKQKELIQWAVDLARWSLREGREIGPNKNVYYVDDLRQIMNESVTAPSWTRFSYFWPKIKCELTTEKEVQKIEMTWNSFNSLNGFYIHTLRRAVGWLSFVDDVATLEEFESWKREVLQAILGAGPLTGDEIVKKAWAGSNASKKGKRLSEMVSEGLLISSRGANSGGYRLTPYGRRLAQLCAQLGA